MSRLFKFACLTTAIVALGCGGDGKDAPPKIDANKQGGATETPKAPEGKNPGAAGATTDVKPLGPG